MTLDPSTDPGAFAAMVLGPQGDIVHDVHCVHCGYNLRGLTANQGCPECGTPISRSLHPDLLCFAKPQWIQTLARGMNWILITIFASFILNMLGSMIFGIRGGSSVPMNSPQGSSIYTIATTMLLGAMGLYGYWMVTTPDPRQPVEGTFSARKMVRVCMTAAYLLAIPAVMNTVFPPQVIMGLGLVNTILAITGVFALFVYAKHLALRIPDPALEASTHICMWGMVIAHGLIIFGSMVMLLFFFVVTVQPCKSYRLCSGRR